MREILPEFLTVFAENLPKPLYLVGGMVRNYLAGLPVSTDLDVAGAMPVTEVVQRAKEVGGEITAVYPKTNTARIRFHKEIVEYTQFRTERYPKGGAHTPIEVTATEDIVEDAKRRDFTVNAIYYDIAGGTFCDPLEGRKDIAARTLRAWNGKKVFESDGLRLMRLARFAAQLNFGVHPDTLAAAKEYKANLRDIAGERLGTELSLILLSDTAYPVSGGEAPLRGLSVLRETGVLFELFPALLAADGMPQRKDYHDHDVLTHSLLAVRYAPPVLAVRLAALLHDIGKPTAFYQSGKPTSDTPAAMAGHEVLGAPLTREALRRIKTSNSLTEEVLSLCRLHGFVAHETTRLITVRRFLSEHERILPHLFALMQADHSAQKGDLGETDSLRRLRGEYDRMKKESVPFSVQDLAVTGEDLSALGYRGREIGETLSAFLEYCLLNPKDNDKQVLLRRAKRKKLSAARRAKKRVKMRAEQPGETTERKNNKEGL